VAHCLQITKNKRIHSEKVLNGMRFNIWLCYEDGKGSYKKEITVGVVKKQGYGRAFQLSAFKGFLHVHGEL
jgi:hypothetical protein